MAFVFYLLLTASSGEFILFSYAEILLAFFVAILVGFLTRKVQLCDSVLKFLSPKRWLTLFLYLVGPFFFSMVKANLDVAYRILTGKINPGIVKISPELKSDLAIVMLANSITLTPGTLSIDIKEGEIYVHWINVKSKEPKIEEVCGNFHKWIKKILE